VRNDGNIPDLEDDDVVEVPCVVTKNGARPLHVGRLPAAVRELVVQVKRYERLTVQAALARVGSETELARSAANAALAENPLVGSAAAAAAFVRALSP
jgi:6-phospho-beta-glucosidase